MPRVLSVYGPLVYNAGSLTLGAGQSSYGSYIDFSSLHGRKFWKNGVSNLLDFGVTGIWNDNNEFSIPDDDHVCALNGGTNVS